ncbi:hypothetical protein EC988_002675, partial [Linderina pennispora]
QSRPDCRFPGPQPRAQAGVVCRRVRPALGGAEGPGAGRVVLGSGNNRGAVRWPGDGAGRAGRALGPL